MRFPFQALARVVLGLYGFVTVGLHVPGQQQAMAAGPRAEAWRAKLSQELPLLGHRNWIAVVDSAYPLQMKGGIETIDTGASQLEVVKAVLDALGKSKHVRPLIHLDKELAFVPEGAARGIGAYRTALQKLLAKRSVDSIPHEQIIGQLDKAGDTFHVLVLKTNMTLPYTSVFLQLDCKYWSAESEKKLREAMAKRGG